jgi:predicted CXXCH cytochrome family protein
MNRINAGNVGLRVPGSGIRGRGRGAWACTHTRGLAGRGTAQSADPGHPSRHRRLGVLSALMVLWAVGPVSGQGTIGQHSVVGSPHDLSVSGPGPIHALNEEQVCIFCHAPHHATGQAPLWNRYMPPTHYRVYHSSTTDARIDQPSGPSKMCLSCHDGALALGLVASRPPDDPIVMSRRTIPPGRSDLTLDLSDDHPIGFRYDRALAIRDRQLRVPDILSGELRFGPHNEVHCTTCHDPHDNAIGNFLRVPELRSALCTTCHDMIGWTRSAHALSGARIHDRAADPRERMRFQNVAENGCANCHKVHSAPQPERLLRFCRLEDNCLNCHNGSVVRTNIESEIHKPSAHPVGRTFGQHQPKENPLVMPRHVQCVDCHNPHASRPPVIRTTVTPTLGFVEPSERFVSGINLAGTPVANVSFEYEICFKCHADSVTRSRQVEVVRQVTQTNVRLQFLPANPAFHPITGPRNNRDVVSLIPPLRVSSMIRCTDCHNSDLAAQRGPGATFGPHGSIYDPILIANYTTRDFTVESSQAYALCYRCHDRQSILSNQSFPLHSRHIVRGRAPCSACHDAHGIFRGQGNSTNHYALINFDLAIVRSASGGLGARIQYDHTGQYKGSCTLTCHNVVHVDFQYGK